MTHRRSTLRPARRLLAALLLALVAWPTVAQQLPIFPYAEPRIKVWKSEIDVGYVPKFFWIDNETVIFAGRAANLLMTEEMRKESPLYVTRWHVPSNRVTYGPEVDARFCYWRDGNVSFVTYRREHGRRYMTRGWYVEDLYFGPVDAPRKLEGEEKDAFRNRIDEATCGPREPDAEMPHWIDRKRYNAKRVSEGWVVSTVRPPEPPCYCADGVRRLEDCARLPLPPGVHPSGPYVEHLKGFALRGAFGGIGDAYVVLIQGSQVRNAWRVVANKISGSPSNDFFTRIGLVEILNQYGSAPRARGGLYHVQGAKRVHIMHSHTTTGYSRQHLVSPDGCRVAFGGAKDMHERVFTAWVADLCG